VEGRCARQSRAFCFPLFATFCNYFLFRKFKRWDDALDYVVYVLGCKLQTRDRVIAKGIEQEMDVVLFKVRALYDELCVVPGICFDLELKLGDWVI